MKNKSKYTEKLIVESIVHWSTYMLENNMATEAELKNLLSEGLFKKAIAGVKNAIGKTKDALKDAKDNLKEKIHDIFKPNAGVLKMLLAMEKIANSKVELDGVKMYASLGGLTLPVIGFAMANKKKTLVLLVDKDNKSAKPKTLTDIRKFIVDDLKIKLVKSAIESILCAQVSATMAESVLLESKKKDSDNSEDSTAKPSKKTSKKKPSSKKTSKKKSSETKAEPSEEPLTKDVSDDKSDTGSAESSSASTEDTTGDSTPTFNSEETPKEDTKLNKDAFKLFDNKLIDVEAKGSNIGFIFSKTKAEIALDKKYTDAFSV